MTRLAVPGDQVQSLVDLMDSFGPPLAQIEALRSELAEQRALFEQLGERLAHMESLADRLVIAGEQLVAYQEPFVRMAAMFTGQDFERRSARSGGDGEDSTRSSGAKGTARTSGAKGTTRSSGSKGTARSADDDREPS